MASLELNGIPVVSGRIYLPRIGLWTADLELEDAEAPTGPVTLASDDGAFSLSGFVRRGGSFAEIARVHVVAGAGGLDQEAPAAYYRGVTVRTPLQALLSAVGESLAGSANATALGQYLERWTREKGPAGLSLARLAEAAGVDWRALDDGTIWLGTDAYPDASVEEEDYELLEDTPEQFRAIISTEGIPSKLRPGTTFLGRKVEFVEYNVRSASIAAHAWFQRAASSSHPILGPLQRIIQHETRETKYHAPRAARVAAQHDDDSLDCVFDSGSEFPHMTRVPLYKFTPGVTQKVAVGARVLVWFSDGDPSKPFVFGFGDGTTTEVPVADGGTLVFSPGSGGAALSFVQPGVTPPPPGAGTVNIPLSGRIKS